MQKEIPLFLHQIDNNLLKEIPKILKKNDNSKTKELEDKLSKLLKIDYVLSVINSSLALHLAMYALNIKRGDKVICGVNSFVDISNAIRHFDSVPLFVDCVENGYNMDLDKLESVINSNKSKKLKAIIINHIAGDIIDLDRVYKIAKENNLKVIEDATYAMGAKYKNRFIGNSGADITIFGFSPPQSISTINGAMFVTNDLKMYEKAEIVKNNGINQDNWDRFYGIDYLYDVISLGWAYNMSEIDALFAISIIDNLDYKIKREFEIAKRYNKNLKDTPYIKLPTIDNISDNKDKTFSLYIIEVATNRDFLAKELKDKNIETSLHHIPLHLMTYYKKRYSFKIFDFPTALSLYQKIISLPIYPSMSDEDVDIVSNAIKDIIAKKYS
jgi:dTDP-4-amino-4,6-dideoxygalactose transaminase